jgi:hypothetical protein
VKAKGLACQMAIVRLRGLNDRFVRQTPARRGSRINPPGLAVKGFQYLRDPLFLGGCVLYALNRWLLKPHLHQVFLNAWFNDLLLIPCALPPLLWMHRLLKLRGHDAPPSAAEIGLHLAFWSLLFEWWGPHLFRHATGDWLDVAAYVVGGIAAWGWWNRNRIFGWDQTHGL